MERRRRLRRRRRSVWVGGVVGHLHVLDCPGEAVGAVVWPAGLAMARHFAREDGDFRDVNCVELGAGTGIVGLTLACRGARVCLTDRRDLVRLLEAQINDRRLPHQPTVAALNWGDSIDGSLQGCDVLVAADVLYKEESFVPLVTTMVGLRPKRVLLAYQERAKVNVESFMSMASTFFAVMSKVQLELPEGAGNTPIYMLEMAFKHATNEARQNDKQ